MLKKFLILPAFAILLSIPISDAIACNCKGLGEWAKSQEYKDVDGNIVTGDQITVDVYDACSNQPQFQCEYGFCKYYIISKVTGMRIAGGQDVCELLDF